MNYAIGQNYCRNLDEHRVHIAQFMQETIALRNSVGTFDSCSFLSRDDFNMLLVIELICEIPVSFCYCMSRMNT